MAHGTRILGGLDHGLYQPVGGRVAEAVLRDVGLEAVLVRLLEDFQPPRVPGGLALVPQYPLRVVQRPHSELLLLRRQLVVLHTSAADCEGVKVGDHRLHGAFGVGNKQGMRVHGILRVHLDKDHLGFRVPDDCVQVHVHERRLGLPARLPAREERDVLLEDVGLPQDVLRHLQAVRLRVVPIVWLEHVGESLFRERGVHEVKRALRGKVHDDACTHV
mmetsp:Transcript_110801/g.294351  ORF Transcript_110801/g.294351 Transcript_110801/m.294351 type:complete len:218 (+) Transcript_110801:601-1254(+)